ncbi:hypothetical protein MKW94_023438 [Papaver nudicaule]|uniref:Cation/H+ exchanger domain-containing protein n=1 Tax=Papaver nudicaule TaxID=74823 RepID=A0AA41VJN6_PAPNU|nr:hypothetical protein [Papaver nudicaule]
MSSLFGGPRPTDPAFSDTGRRDDAIAGCFDADLISYRGMFDTERRPYEYTLILFFMQLTVTVVLHRLLDLALKRFRQPPIVALALSGLLVGPTFLGKNETFKEIMYPLFSLQLLETVGLLGLMFKFFALGVMSEPSAISSNPSKQRGMLLFLANMIVVFSVSIITYVSYHPRGDNRVLVAQNIVLAAAFSMTGFTNVNFLLVELRLFNTEMGRIIRSCTIFETLLAWVLLPVAINLKKKPPIASVEFDAEDMEKNGLAFKKNPGLWKLSLNTLFILFCIVVIRPIIKFIIRRTPDGHSFKENYLISLLVAVLISGVITDFSGTQVVFGPYMFGLMIPNGPLGSALVGKVDFGNGIMLPLYFVTTGLRTWVEKLFTKDSIFSFTVAHHAFVHATIWIAAAKSVTTVFVTQIYKMPLVEGIVLALIINVKGFNEFIIINAGFDQEILEDRSFAFAVCFAILVSAVIGPIIKAVYKPPRHFLAYKRRSVQTPKGEPELRMLSCIHNPRTALSTINLLHACQPTKKHPFFVCAVHLVEIAEGHRPGRSTSTSDRSQPEIEQIMRAFEKYRKSSPNGSVSIENHTTVSPYSSMHEEICQVAEQNGIAFIILPFHKQQTIDGGMEETNPFFRDINNSILNNAPCSVGILVDRGFGGTLIAEDCEDDDYNSHNVAVLFFGGPDDREALAFAWKMVNRRNVTVTVIRFVPKDDTSKYKENLSSEMGILKLIIDSERETQQDDSYISQFKKQTSHNSSVMYQEKLVSDAEEVVNLIRSVDNLHDLFIVGRGRGVVNPLTASMIDWSECPELGPIGDLLASQDFRTTTSVLVMQQYLSIEAGSGDGTETPNSQYNDLYDNFYNVNQVSSPHSSSQGLSQRRTPRLGPAEWHY